MSCEKSEYGCSLSRWRARLHGVKGCVGRKRSVNCKGCTNELQSSELTYIHKMTTWIAQNYGFIATEDLNVAGMVRNKHPKGRSRMLRLAKLCANLTFGKSSWLGGEVQNVDMFFL